MTIDPQRAQALFLAASELSDSVARRELLDQECGQDAVLRQRVEALLSAHGATGGFDVEPSDPAFGATVATSEVVRPGTVIAGRYKLRQQIGEGGMGTVWMADQAEPVKRKVAVKLVRVERGQSKTILARFEAERQAIALMDHPHIAKLLDAGTTETGAPYFVMELVKGVPLNVYCDQHKLTVPDRLNLFTQICSAVQHAHQKGIIHRDLKPSNILVESHDGKPVPKVIDFGLAKATSSLQLTEKSMFTAFGSVMGTPLYMAPEQANFNAVDIDTRADVYALGVILYELLTGTTPITRETMKKAALDEMLKLIREQEAQTPSSRLSSVDSAPSVAATRQMEPLKLGRFVRGELDWIVLKALSKDRDRRYETAIGFARDIERFLNHEPVTAGPPSARYRLQKFVQRNRGPVIAASLVLLALVGGVVGTTAGLLEAKRQERLALAAVKAERDAKQEAEAKRMETEKTLAYAKKGNEILDLVFQSLDPAKSYATVAELRNDLKANLIEATRQLENAPIGDPRVVADMRARLGITLMNLGEEGIAIRLHEQSLESTLANLGDDHDDTNDCRGNLGLAYLRVERHEHALPLLEKAVASARKVNGLDHESTLRHMNNLAGGYVDSGQSEKALPLFQEVLQRRQALLGLTHTDTLASMKNLVVGLVRADQYKEALSLCLKTVELMTSEYGENDLRTLRCRFDLATCYVELGQADQAKEIQKQIIRPLTANLGANHRDVILLMNNLALSYGAAGQLDKALPLLEEILSLTKAKSGPDHDDTVRSMNNLATGYVNALQFDKALPLLEETLKIVRLGRDHSNTLMIMGNLANSYAAARQFDKALPLLEETLSLTKDKFGHDHVDTVKSMINLATGYVNTRQFDKALPLLEETLKLAPDHSNTLMIMGKLANSYAATGKFDKSLPLLEEILSLTKAKSGPDHANTLASMNNLAEGYVDAGQFDKALPLHQETLLLMKDKLPPDNPNTLVSMNNVAVCYWSMKQLDQSVPRFEQLLTLREKTLGRPHQETQMTVANLGVNYKDAGRVAEAIPLLEEAYGASKKFRNLGWVGQQLIDAYAKAGKPAEAAKLVDELLTDARKALPEDSPQLAGQLASFGLGLLEMKAYAEAEPLLRECLAIRETKEPEDWRTFNTQSLLGGALLGQKNSADAELLLHKGYEGMKAREESIPPQGSTRIPEALDRLIQLYTETSKPDEVTKWQAERAKYPPAATNNK